MKRLTIGLVAVSAACMVPALALADVSFTSRLFSDGMVLQRQMPVPIWGRAGRGERVTVSVEGARPSTCVDNLVPQNITSQTVITTADARGNWRVNLAPMEAGGPYVLTVTGQNTLTVRCVMVGEVWLATGQSNMAIGAPSRSVRARYRTVRAFRSRGWADRPSGTAFWFAAELSARLGVTVGVLNQAVGGTPIHRWLAPEVTHDPDPDVQAMLAGLPGFGSDYRRLVAPLRPYAIRGNIWWQGESDFDRPNKYAHLLPALIRSWRADWGQGAFPFYFVQLPTGGGARFGNAAVAGVPPGGPPATDRLPLMANAYFEALSLPNTGMVISVDLKRTLHPPNKRDYGRRFAEIALANVYKDQLVYSGPVLERAVREGNTLRLQFKNNTADGLYPLATGSLQGFSIAGIDQQFVWAAAQIQGNEVIVADPDNLITQPVYVRYAWGDWPTWANLFNAANQGAAIFQAAAVESVATPGPQAGPICTSGIPLTFAGLKVFRNVAPAGGQSLRLGGFVRLPDTAGPIALDRNGFSFFVTDESGGTVFTSRELPAGSDRWKQSSNKRMWQYVDPTGSVGGVKKVSVISIPLRGRNFYQVRVVATKGAFLLPAGTVPLNLTIVMGGSQQAADGLCATQVFNASGGPPPVCTNVGTVLACG
jgi:sialate O-acetylesterase